MLRYFVLNGFFSPPEAWVIVDAIRRKKPHLNKKSGCRTRMRTASPVRLAGYSAEQSPESIREPQALGSRRAVSRESWRIGTRERRALLCGKAEAFAESVSMSEPRDSVLCLDWGWWQSLPPGVRFSLAPLDQGPLPAAFLMALPPPPLPCPSQRRPLRAL